MTFGPVCSNCFTLNASGADVCAACLAALDGGLPSRVVRLVAGRKGKRVELARLSGAGRLMIGRSEGDLRFEGDMFMSPRHMEVVSSPEGVRLVDQGSPNGVYVRIAEAEIRVGDMFMCASQVLKLIGIVPEYHEDDDDEYMGSPRAEGGALILQQVLLGGKAGATWIRNSPVVIGREEGDIRFPSDLYVSSKHSRLESFRNRVLLRDLGSANGTWLRIRGEQTVKNGDNLIAGRQMMMIEIEE